MHGGQQAGRSGCAKAGEAAHQEAADRIRGHHGQEGGLHLLGSCAPSPNHWLLCLHAFRMLQPSCTYRMPPKWALAAWRSCAPISRGPSWCHWLGTSFIRGRQDICQQHVQAMQYGSENDCRISKHPCDDISGITQYIAFGTTLLNP